MIKITPLIIQVLAATVINVKFRMGEIRFQKRIIYLNDQCINKLHFQITIPFKPLEGFKPEKYVLEVSFMRLTAPGKKRIA